MSDLCIAAARGNSPEVKRLVESGADVNERNVSTCKIALHYAVHSGSLEVVKCLIDHGSNVNCEDKLNFTVLDSAVISGSLEIVKYLVEHGSNVTCEEYHGQKNVLHWACEYGHHLIVDYLLQHGAMKDINRHHDGSSSPLGLACSKGHTAVVQTLLKFNVDIRKEKELQCYNNEIINILNLELKKSVKHREITQMLRAMDEEKLTKVGPPVKYISTDKTFSLGTGHMGTSVYVGIMEDGSEVAVKRMLIQACEDAAENEKNILSLIDTKKSPFIVSYRHFLRDNNFIYLIIDLCEETLNEHVSSQTVEHLRGHGRRMIKEILTGLEFLHAQKILHRDLKPSNVLVDVEGHMRLADFGISRVLNDDETTVETDPKGTQGWMPTEVIKTICQSEKGSEEGRKGRFKKKSDVQAAGMIAFFILTKGKHLFGSSSFDRMNNIFKGNPVNLDILDDLESRQFVLWLTSHNIDDRPYAHEVLNHSYLECSIDYKGAAKPILAMLEK